MGLLLFNLLPCLLCNANTTQRFLTADCKQKAAYALSYLYARAKVFSDTHTPAC